MKKVKEKVIKLIALGWQNKDIAKELGYSFSTVKLFIVYLLKEYNAKNRSELVINYLKKEKNFDIINLLDK